VQDGDLADCAFAPVAAELSASVLRTSSGAPPIKKVFATLAVLVGQAEEGESGVQEGFFAVFVFLGSEGGEDV